VAKPERALHDIEEERAVPWGDPGLFAWHRARYDFALRFVAGQRVLDVGCGEGYGPALLAKRAREVVAVDYSPEAVRHAHERYASANVRFEVADATELSSSLGEFDVVTCFEVIEHIERDDTLLSGIKRILRPAGLLILSTPNALVDRLFETVGAHEHYEYHVNMLTPAELRKRAKRHFRSVTIYGQSVRGNTLHTIIKAADVMNLRHRLVRSASLQHAMATRFMGQTQPVTQLPFRFSRLLVRQSPHTVLLGRT
jgi:2-polyprenyl-3-methyl-5-hydroxy-6-metoxy-1,4-benzoquinol methylase